MPDGYVPYRQVRLEGTYRPIRASTRLMIGKVLALSTLYSVGPFIAVIAGLTVHQVLFFYSQEFVYTLATISLVISAVWAHRMIENARRLGRLPQVRLWHVIALHLAGRLIDELWSLPMVFFIARVASAVASYIVWSSLWAVCAGTRVLGRNYWLLTSVIASLVGTIASTIALDRRVNSVDGSHHVVAALVIVVSNLVGACAFAIFVHRSGRAQMQATGEA